MFAVTLGRHSSMHSVSNMPLKAITPITDGEIPGIGTGYFWDEFETTKPMSTYLLAFLVSELASTAVEVDEEEPWTMSIHHIPG